MAETRFNPWHHDYIPPEVLAREQETNKTILEAHFEEECRLFRSRMFGLLNTYGVLKDGKGWAVYCNKKPNNSKDTAATTERKTEWLVHVTILPNAPEIEGVGRMPVIRIISNESYCTSKNTEWLEYDFVLDHEDDAQFMVTAHNPEIYKELQRKEAKTFSTIFCVNKSGKLQISENYQSFTPVYVIEFEDIDEGEMVVPFGHYGYIWDKVEALEVGKQLLSQIESAHLVHSSAE